MKEGKLKERKEPLKIMALIVVLILNVLIGTIWLLFELKKTPKELKYHM